MSIARRYAMLGMAGLFVMQFFWHGFLLPPQRAPAWLIAGAFALPMVPAVLLAILRHPHAGFWGSVAALLYFCHGVMEAWTDPEARPLALLEAGLSVWLIVAASWDGMKARFRRKAQA